MPEILLHIAALTVGPSHNYYEGRAEADITKWVEYFCVGMADSFENVRRRAMEAAGSGAQDRSPLLRQLDLRQRKVLELFREQDTITSRDIGTLFGISDRAARNLLAAWVENSFLIIVDAARKSRRYRLAIEFYDIIKN